MFGKLIIFGGFWQHYAVEMPLIDFSWLNLPIKVKNLQKSHIQIPCTCSAKIEAGYSSEFRRSLEPRICNFSQRFLHRITKWITLKSNCVNNLNLAIVWIPLLNSSAFIFCISCHILDQKYFAIVNPQLFILFLCYIIILINVLILFQNPLINFFYFKNIINIDYTHNN